MHRFYVYAFIVTLALALASCQGMGKFLPRFSGGSGKAVADFLQPQYSVWPMMGAAPDNNRNSYMFHGYAGPDPDLPGGIDLLWQTPITTDDPPAIYSSPVVHLGSDNRGAPLHWEDIFVVDENGNAYGLDGWDDNDGQRQGQGKVTGVSHTSGDDTFVVASAGTKYAYDAGGEPDPRFEGSFNSVVFCDGSGHLRYFCSNGDPKDGLSDPTYDGGGLIEYNQFSLENPPTRNIGGDYAACALTVDLNYDKASKCFYTGTYHRNATLGEPAGRLYRVLIGAGPTSSAINWEEGSTDGVPLEIDHGGGVKEGFDAESMMCFADSATDVFVVGRARPHETNKARMFVYDNQTGQQLFYSPNPSFDWFAEANYDIEPGMRSSPVIEDETLHDDIVYAYLAIPHGDRTAQPYPGDDIIEFTGQYNQSTGWAYSQSGVYNLPDLMAQAGTLPPGTPTHKYYAASPALDHDHGVLVAVLNMHHEGFEGWKLCAFDMNAARTGVGALVAASEPMTGRCDSSPAIDANGDVWVAADNELHLFQNFVLDGGIQGADWSSAGYAEFQGRIWSSPAIGYTSEIDPEHLQHTLYIADDAGWVYAFADNMGVMPPPPPPPVDPIWAMQGENGQHQFYQDLEGFVDPGPFGQLGNSIFAGDKSASDPAIAENGDIYITTRGGVLEAFHLDGVGQLTPLWTFDTYDRSNEGYYRDAFCWSSPAIGSDGTIYYIHPDAMLVAVNPDGTEKWTGDFDQYPPGDPHKWMCAMPSPTVWNAPYGDLIYASSYDAEATDRATSYLYCFDSDGNQVGCVTTNDGSVPGEFCLYPTAPAIVPELGRLYLASYDKDQSGWAFRMHSFNLSAIHVGPMESTVAYACNQYHSQPMPTAVRFGNGLYRLYTAVDTTVYAFDDHLNWVADTSAQRPFKADRGLTLDKTHRFLLLSTETMTSPLYGQIVAFDLDLGLQWESEPLDLDKPSYDWNGVDTEVSVDSGGHVYVATEHRLYVLNSVGQWLWSSPDVFTGTTPGHNSSPSIDLNRRVYTVTADGELFAFGPQ